MGGFNINSLAFLNITYYLTYPHFSPEDPNLTPKYRQIVFLSQFTKIVIDETITKLSKTPLLIPGQAIFVTKCM